jgi:hypothetical protein
MTANQQSTNYCQLSAHAHVTMPLLTSHGNNQREGLYHMSVTSDRSLPLSRSATRANWL